MKKGYSIVIVILFLCIFCFGRNAQAEEAENVWSSGSEEQIQKDESGNPYIEYYLPGYYTIQKQLTFKVKNQDVSQDSEPVIGQVQYTGTDSEICEMDRIRKQYESDSGYMGNTLWLELKNPGIMTITAKILDKEYSIKVIVYPTDSAEIKSYERISYYGVRLVWKEVYSASGYVVMRRRYNHDRDNPWESVAVIDDPKTVSVDTKQPLQIKYEYGFFPKMKVGEREYSSAPVEGQADRTKTGRSVSISNVGHHLKSLSCSGTDLTVEWTPNSFVRFYNILIKKTTDAKWQVAKSILQKEQGSYTMTCEPGCRYDVKVYYIYQSEVRKSRTLSVYIPNEVSGSQKKKLKIYQRSSSGQYSYGYASPERVFYYQKGEKLHVVSEKKPKLIDYELNKKGKIVSKKKISLGKYDSWGTFFQGDDGNFYVAVGFENTKHSKKKTVIKIYKYSPEWKKLGTGKLMGATVGNEDEPSYGVASPFGGGGCRMINEDDKIYMVTSCRVFNGAQETIAFWILPGTMKCGQAQDLFTSNCLNRYAAYENEFLYMVNHGNAYPRGIRFNSRNIHQGWYYKVDNIFQASGKGTYNTGMTVGGMDFTNKYVLVAGTSLPQKYEVAGVTGNKGAKVKNVYLLTCNKTVEDYKLTWLTNYHPMRSKIQVGEVRMVKLSGDYMVLLYSTTRKKKSTVHYVLLNADGEVAYQTEYAGMEFHGDTQPILSQGSIVWTESDGSKTFLYKIPAKIAE